jgi:hypothetical protein
VASNGKFALLVLEVLETAQPQTVFVDGPNGFTFVWMPDRGWRFGGQIVDRQ